MRFQGQQLPPPLDFRFLDLFVVLLLCLGGFSVTALLLGVGGGFKSPLEIASTLIPDTALNRPFSYAFVARGGRPPYTWQAEGLPAGMETDQRGFVSGSPHAVGTYNITVSVSDDMRSLVRKELVLRVVDYGNLAPLRLLTESLPVGQVGGRFQLALAAEGGALPYKWSVDDLPDGLSLKGGSLEGKPAVAGLFPLAIAIADATGQSAKRELNLQILPARLGSELTAAEPLRISTTMPPAVAGSPYSLQLAATGGRPPYQWQMVSPYPETHLSLQGVLEATDPEQWADGSAFMIRVFDQNNDVATATLTPTIVRTNGWFLRLLLGLAALGGWVILMLLLHVVSRQGVPVASRWQRQPNAFLSLAFFLVSATVAFSTYVGILLFSFIVAATATYILVKHR